MGTYFWAHWLADALRKDAFVADRLIEVPGWQTRGRPPSQFNFLPTGILDHHTACMIRRGHDPQSCLNGILVGRPPDAPGPVSQLLGTWTPPGVRWDGSNADPRVLVVAAGRSNHAGVGSYPWGAPDGNGSSIGIEWCGPPEVGEWPDVVIELRERVDAAILRHNGWGIHQVTTHWEYAEPKGRKIDPSGPHEAEPNLGSVQPWDPNKWRAAVLRRFAEGSTPRPPVVVPPPVVAPPKPPEPPKPPTFINLENDMQIITSNPPRLLDTRKSGVLTGGAAVRVDLPAEFINAKAVMVNLTAVRPNTDGYAVAGGAEKLANVSHLSMTGRETNSNCVPIPVHNGGFVVYVSTGTHLLVDLLGFWA